MVTQPSAGAEVRLSFGEDGRVLTARGACVEVLEVTAADLAGRLVWEVLRVDPAPVRTLHARSGEGVTLDFLPLLPAVGNEPRIYLRLQAWRAGDTCELSLVNLSGLLRGAPPVQVSALSSSLSHELRNPLSSIKLAVQTLARNQTLGERDRRRLTIAHREIRTLERMLWMLSEYGRDTAPHVEDVTLKFLLQQALEMIDPELKEREIALSVEEPRETSTVRVDLARIRPVLAQLILNVAMGLEKGTPLKVHLLPEADGAHGGILSIEDPSSELVPEESLTLFEPFGSRLARGAGLSLAALRQVMRHQDGEVKARVLESGGTVFTLHFPGAD